jgi:PAS domain S-box-containing protein
MIPLSSFKHPRESFQAKIFFILAVLILIISVAFTILYVRHESHSQKAHLITEGDLLARHLAHSCRLAVFAEQGNVLREKIDEILQYKQTITSVTIYGTDRKILASRVRGGREDGIGEELSTPEQSRTIAQILELERKASYFEKDDSMEFFAPVVAGGEDLSPDALYFTGSTGSGTTTRILGVVRVVLDKKGLNKELRELLGTAILVVTLFFIVALLVAYLLAREVTRPLNRLMAGVKTLEGGDLSVRVSMITQDELGKVSHAFNSMAEALERREQENRVLSVQLQSALKQEAKEEWERTFDTMPDLIAILDGNDRIARINRPMADRLGIHKDDAPGIMLYESLFVDAAPPDFSRRTDLLAAGATYFGEVFEENLHRYFFVTVSPLQRCDGSMAGSVFVARDITERKNLLSQLFQSQKMEAIGQIAGGIAHDFNNLLTVIIGFANIAVMRTRPGDPSLEYLEQILAASDRATHLIQGLLAFSRRQILDPRPIDLNALVRGMEKLLRRLITEDIEMNTTLSDRDLVVLADAGQIDQILMNLAANARDAQPNGGMLSIETSLQTMTDDYVRLHGYGSIGQYAMLAVSDTGAGMDGEIRARIFEPFFTTKGPGKGTGLGLAIVYGIVKQHNGFINVYSEPSVGTIFKIYLPLVKIEKVSKDPAAEDAPTVRGGMETVLVLEDNPEVRTLIRSLLETYGYRVIEAEDGLGGVALFSRHKDDISLVITDVVMPRMGGKEAISEMEKIRPGIKVLFTSGYTPDVVHKKGILLEGINFISKPSMPRELLMKIREILDSS